MKQNVKTLEGYNSSYIRDMIGTVVVCLDGDNVATLTFGEKYKLRGVEYNGRPVVINDSGKRQSYSKSRFCLEKDFISPHEIPEFSKLPVYTRIMYENGDMLIVVPKTDKKIMFDDAETLGKIQEDLEKVCDRAIETDRQIERIIHPSGKLLFKAKPKHTIVIDGRTIEVSEESFLALKSSLLK